MADAAASRAMLQDMGLSQPAADATYTDQGMQSIESWAHLSYGDLKGLIHTVRKPGGGEDGHAIPFAATIKMSQMLTMIRHLSTVQRPCTFADVRSNALDRYRAQNKMEVAYEASPPKPEAPKINWSDPTKAVTLLETYLSHFRGTTGLVPLSYTVRKEAVPPAAGDDPATNYRTLDMEKIARAPIFQPGAVDPTEEDGPFHPDFVSDDAEAFELVLPLFQEAGAAWVHIKRYRGQRSARVLHIAWMKYALGENRLDHEVQKLTKKLQNLTFTGPKRGWGLDTFLTSHTETHGHLEALEPYGYKGLNGNMKVHYLLEGTRYDPLQPAKATIMSNHTLRNDFEASSNLFKDFWLNLSATQAGPDHRNVSGLDSGDKKPTIVEDRFYSPKEYELLSDEQRAELTRLREERNAKKGKKNSAANKHSKKIENQRKELKAKNRKIKKMSAQIAKLQSAAADGDDDSSDSSGELAAARR